jgi:hypothetical protein
MIWDSQRDNPDNKKHSAEFAFIVAGLPGKPFLRISISKYQPSSHKLPMKIAIAALAKGIALAIFTNPKCVGIFSKSFILK